MGFKKRETMLVIAAVIVLLLLVGDKVIVSSLSVAWKDQNKQIADLKRKITMGEELKDREELLLNRWEERLAACLPDESQAEELVRKRVGEWMQNTSNQFIFTSLRPQRSRQNERRRQKEFRTVEFRLSAEGTMEDITKFLYGLEQDELALYVEEVDLAPRGGKMILDLTFTGLLIPEKAVAANNRNSRNE